MPGRGKTHQKEANGVLSNAIVDYPSLYLRLVCGTLPALTNVQEVKVLALHGVTVKAVPFTILPVLEDFWVLILCFLGVAVGAQDLAVLEGGVLGNGKGDNVVGLASGRQGLVAKGTLPLLFPGFLFFLFGSKMPPLHFVFF